MALPIGRRLALLLRRSWTASWRARRQQQQHQQQREAASRPWPAARARVRACAAGPRAPPLSTSSAGRMASREFNPPLPATDWKVAKKHLEEIDQTERRCYYKSERFVVLDEVPTWKDFSAQEELKQPATHYKKDDILNEKVSLLQEDLTKLEIDAIVNAANSSLMGGGGVDGCIHSAAGPLLKKECWELGGCSPGDAKITGGYCLPAKYVIHTVGPVVRGKERLPEKVLQSCYETSLGLARENNLRTIAFPCVSTGIYGYPNGQAAETVLKTVRHYLEEHRNSFDRIIFCVFLKIDYILYKEKLPFYFPFEDVPPGSSKEKPKAAEEGEKQTKDALNLEDNQEDVPPGSSKEKPKAAEEDEKQTKDALNLEDNQGAKTAGQLSEQRH